MAILSAMLVTNACVTDVVKALACTLNKRMAIVADADTCVVAFGSLAPSGTPHTEVTTPTASTEPRPGCAANAAATSPSAA